MTLSEIYDLIKNELSLVDKKILEQFTSKVLLVNQVGHYIVNNGGKKIRPVIALLCSKAIGLNTFKALDVAVFIELIHTATLLHDDVVDESVLRRGEQTAHKTFGNAASILVGDYIYTRSFQIMANLDSLPIIKIMSDATNIIAEGEVLQLMNCNNPEITESEYIDVIYFKTARLFEATTSSIGILNKSNNIELEALRDYGKYIGTTFQIIDDYLDYVASDERIGKRIGDDLNEGKTTLPVIHARSHASPEEKEFIDQAILKPSSNTNLTKMIQIFEKYNSLEYVKERAKNESQKAIQAISIIQDSVYKDALINLAKLASSREY
ncbi:octaprenyl diphosphate synthase [Paraphotobacterium marinum]|uniref:Octaprenyl diphosphate synthase n=1 Tax=Paraphotobacterium marinum TaxID=1755811 RepID=A0A220VES5_9GAMM|nr:octaprenyl diphosphate synthase [Paraphotobacterium marinum]ASK78849.1 octaprenyl diphosphate synthase [Paraphotobacterium marinum]